MPKAYIIATLLDLVGDPIRKPRGIVRIDQPPLPARELAPDPRDPALADRIATPLLMLPPAPEVHRQQDVHAEDVDDRDDEIHRS